ncbi:hypothetical protein D3C81_2061920 [compost metagenome]
MLIYSDCSFTKELRKSFSIPLGGSNIMVSAFRNSGEATVDWSAKDGEALKKIVALNTATKYFVFMVLLA